MKKIIFCLFLTSSLHSQVKITNRDFTEGEEIYYGKDNYRTVKVSELDEYYNVSWKTWLLDDLRLRDFPNLLDIKTQKDQKGVGNFVNPVVDSLYFNYAAALKVCPVGWRLPRLGEWDTLLRKINQTQRNWMLKSGNGFKGYHSAISDSLIIKESQILEGGFWWASDSLGSKAYVIKVTETWEIGLADVWDYATVRCVKDE